MSENKFETLKIERHGFVPERCARYTRARGVGRLSTGWREAGSAASRRFPSAPLVTGELDWWHLRMLRGEGAAHITSYLTTNVCICLAPETRGKRA